MLVPSRPVATVASMVMLRLLPVMREMDMFFQVAAPLVSGVQEAVQVAPSEKTSVGEPRGAKPAGLPALLGDGEGAAAAELLPSPPLKKPNSGAAETGRTIDEQKRMENTATKQTGGCMLVETKGARPRLVQKSVQRRRIVEASTINVLPLERVCEERSKGR